MIYVVPAPGALEPPDCKHRVTVKPGEVRSFTLDGAAALAAWMRCDHCEIERLTAERDAARALCLEIIAAEDEYQELRDAERRGPLAHPTQAEWDAAEQRRAGARAAARG